MTPDTLQEPEFFSAAAAIAGTLWAIAAGLFTLVIVGVNRSGLLVAWGPLDYDRMPTLTGKADWPQLVFLRRHFGHVAVVIPGTSSATAFRGG